MYLFTYEKRTILLMQNHYVPQEMLMVMFQEENIASLYSVNNDSSASILTNP